MKAEFNWEIADKIRIEGALSKVARRVDQLEREVQVGAIRNESLGFALDTIYVNQRGEVRRHFIDEGEPIRSVQRQVMNGYLQYGQSSGDAVAEVPCMANRCS